MRKTSLLAMMCTAAVLLAACDTNRTNSTVNTASVSSSTEDISYAAMIPDIEEMFPDGKVNTIDSDGGKIYCVQVTGYKDGEYDTYLEACKSKGFADVQFDIHTDTNDKFEARTQDGKYYVSLQLLKDERATLTITCGKRETAD